MKKRTQRENMFQKAVPGNMFDFLKQKEKALKLG